MDTLALAGSVRRRHFRSRAARPTQRRHGGVQLRGSRRPRRQPVPVRRLPRRPCPLASQPLHARERPRGRARRRTAALLHRQARSLGLPPARRRPLPAACRPDRAAAALESEPRHHAAALSRHIHIHRAGAHRHRLPGKLPVGDGAGDGLPAPLLQPPSGAALVDMAAAGALRLRLRRKQ